MLARRLEPSRGENYRRSCKKGLIFTIILQQSLYFRPKRYRAPFFFVGPLALQKMREVQRLGTVALLYAGVRYVHLEHEPCGATSLTAVYCATGATATGSRLGPTACSQSLRAARPSDYSTYLDPCFFTVLRFTCTELYWRYPPPWDRLLLCTKMKR